MTKRETRLARPSALLTLAAMTLAVAWGGCSAQGSACAGDGCPEPVWGSAGGSGSSSGGSPVECYADNECPSGNACVGNVCVATADGGGVTVADAGTSTDASDAAKAPTCGGALGPCACVANSDCPSGQSCALGVCTGVANACEFSSQCASGDVCADGACVPSCEVTACSAGTTCIKGACLSTAATCTIDTQCPVSAPVCAAGHCSAACGGDSGACAAGTYCNQGICQTDTRPAPNCTQTAQCTGSAAQACVAGYCEFTCTTSQQCAEIDARIDTCTAAGYCASAAEANPQCTQKSDCAAGKDCISNVCQ